MRASMLDTIRTPVHETAAQTGVDDLSPQVLAALRSVPRARFVPPAESRFAESDSPLPIGHGQTISQPFIVALMTELLDVKPRHRVLEVGSGSGYQAAVLAELAAQVYGIEIVQPLAEHAREVLAALGYRNVEIRCGDGHGGWPEHAPFDGIVVTAAGRGVPDPLKQQLAIGAKLVLPVESARGDQCLEVIERIDENSFSTRRVLDVRFVPLTRSH